MAAVSFLCAGLYAAIRCCAPACACPWKTQTMGTLPRLLTFLKIFLSQCSLKISFEGNSSCPRGVFAPGMCQQVNSSQHLDDEQHWKPWPRSSVLPDRPSQHTSSLADKLLEDKRDRLRLSKHQRCTQCVYVPPFLSPKSHLPWQARFFYIIDLISSIELGIAK